MGVRGRWVFVKVSGCGDEGVGELGVFVSVEFCLVDGWFVKIGRVIESEIGG